MTEALKYVLKRSVGIFNNSCDALFFRYGAEHTWTWTYLSETRRRKFPWTISAIPALYGLLFRKQGLRKVKRICLNKAASFLARVSVRLTFYSKWSYLYSEDNQKVMYLGKTLKFPIIVGHHESVLFRNIISELKSIRAFLEHWPKMPLGRLCYFLISPSHYYETFKRSRSIS